MRELSPTEFQQLAVIELLGHMSPQFDNLPNNMIPINGYTSPTGSGKTITILHLIEEMILGRIQGRNPMPDLRVLWVSDSPELNEQTRMKFERYSDVLGPGSTYTIDDLFVDEYLRPGVGFINIQKLSRPGLLLNRTDDRQFTFWDILNNTLRDHYSECLIIIDEAHIGMRRAGTTGNRRRTIISNFLDVDSEAATLSRAPKCVGISATIERWNSYISELNRPSNLVTTLPEAVRVSGLLKETIVFHDNQAQDVMVQSAVNGYQNITQQWQQYCLNESEEIVTPLLCIQVEDGDVNQLTNTDLVSLRQQIENCGLNLAGRICNCFGEHEEISIGDLAVPYVPPSEIHEREDILVVLFKQAIVTGWDCPRAEVLISFRSSADYTVVSQLIGRMIRNPLRRRVEADVELNSVHLYLPHFDQDSVSQVIEELTGEGQGLDNENFSRNPQTFHRTEASDSEFSALSELPNYHIRRRSMTQSSLHRVLAACQLLEFEGLSGDIHSVQISRLVEILQSEIESYCQTNSGGYSLGDSISYTPFSYDLLNGEQIILESVEVTPTEQSVLLINRENHRVLTNDLSNSVVSNTDAHNFETIVNLNAVLSTESVISRVETHCTEILGEISETYRTQIENLSESSRLEFGNLFLWASIPEYNPFNAPNSIQLPESNNEQNDHLYTTEDGSFQTSLTDLEISCLEYIRAQPGFLSWMRNPTNQNQGLRIPWRMDRCNAIEIGTQRGKYPDFISVREVEGNHIVDLYEPHGSHLEDWMAIASGFCDFAELHGDSFGCIAMACEYEEEFLICDFNQADIRSILRGAGDLSQFLAAYSSTQGA